MADDNLADMTSIGSEHADAPAGDEDTASERREKAGRLLPRPAVRQGLDKGPKRTVC